MTNTSDIEHSVKDFILNEFLPDEDPTQLTESTPMVTTGILDSIATLKLVLFLEEHFSITIEPYEADAEHLDTIELIAKLVRSKS
jgi:acyl carrier protein